MNNPGRWLAVLRIIIGLFFAKAVYTKLSFTPLAGVVPVPAASVRWVETMPKIVGKQAAGNPIPWFKGFLEHTVIPHHKLFANLTALGEATAGIGLTLGLFSGLASMIGLILVTNYGLATYWMSPGQLGFHLVLFSCMAVFFLARVGREWGVDAILARSKPRSFFTRRPLA